MENRGLNHVTKTPAVSRALLLANQIESGGPPDDCQQAEEDEIEGLRGLPGLCQRPEKILGERGVGLKPLHELKEGPFKVADEEKEEHRR